MKAEYCRGCQSRRLFTVHDFGEQPLAGHYPTEPESVRSARKYPLDLTQCRDCGLLQVVNLPPIEEVFHDDYRYSSSTVPALVNHFVGYAEWLARVLAPGARIFEFGCNDGVLMERLRDLGFVCEGIDASDNVARIARGKGLRVTTGFLTEQYIRRSDLVGQFDAVTCSNVFAHIHELHDTLRAVWALLRVDGLFVIEVHNGEFIRSQNQFDTIYHEHLTYFTEATLRALLERIGFQFVSCLRTSMHGGGLRCVVKRVQSPDSRAISGADSNLEIANFDFVGPVIERCRRDLRQLVAEHGRLVGYGAAGRSQMFINFTRSAEMFLRVHDDSPFRQGRYIAGTDLPVVEFDGKPSECVVILAWNYAEDISRKLRGNAGKIVTLLPELRVW